MFRAVILSGLLALGLALPASAECYVDYKAKRSERPLRLHYGVAEVPDAACDRKAAASELEPRLAAEGWTLLRVLGTFGPEGLAERKESAGEFYLRY